MNQFSVCQTAFTHKENVILRENKLFFRPPTEGHTFSVGLYINSLSQWDV